MYFGGYASLENMLKIYKSKYKWLLGAKNGKYKLYITSILSLARRNSQVSDKVCAALALQSC